MQIVFICVLENWQIRISRSETMGTNLNAGFAGGQLETTKVFEHSVDYFFEFLKFFKNKTSDKENKRYIIFENMEAILGNDDLIRELANLIILMDDDEVIKYKTKFIIIGATKDIHQYFRKVMNVNTIENRIYELPDVGTLMVSQAKELIQRGFEKLKIEFESLDIKSKCIDEYIRVSGGIPQRLHELCLMFSELAINCESPVGEDCVNQGIKKWIQTSLSKNYAYISRLLDVGGNENSFKNRVLYCVAQKDSLYFTKDDIDKELGLEFPEFMEGKNTTSTKVLNELCKCNPPLLSKTEDVFGEYSFIDFKCALCLRAILVKRGEMVYRNDAYDIYIE